jgi:PKD repeat protein
MLLLLSISSPRAFFVAAQSSAVSRIYISPVSICCSMGTPVAAGNSVTFNVMLDLAAGQAFNGFDVRINYTNPYSNGPSGTMRVLNLNYSNNVFTSHNPPAPDAECVDGVGVLSNGKGCAPDDSPSPGQIHFAEGIIGPSVQGPLSAALLFSINFGVMGLGTSQIYFDRWNLVNPQNFNPVFVPLVTYSGIFGNTGLVAFFNYSPSDPTVSVSILPGQPTLFDASASVDAVNSSLTPSNYSWNFGDGSGLADTASPTITHTFSLPGNYSVQLVVTDARRSGSIARTVSVVPALGGLFLTVQDQTGAPLRSNVIVELFNSSLSSTAFAHKTIDTFGQVEFNGLIPGSYSVVFSGQTIVKSSRTETIGPGWTTRDTVLLTPVAAPPDYSWLVYVVPLVGGLGILTAVAVVRRRNLQKRGRVVRMDGKGSKKRQRP